MTELMPGVEILAKNTFNTLTVGQLILLTTGIVIIVISILLLLVDNVFIYGVMVGILLLLFCKMIPNTKTVEYKVTINENVSLIEFNEKYEIIEQNGKIYTIKEIKTNQGDNK